MITQLIFTTLLVLAQSSLFATHPFSAHATSATPTEMFKNLEKITETQVAVAFSLLQDTLAQKKLRSDNLQNAIRLKEALHHIDKQGLPTFKNQLEAPIALILAYTLLVHHFETKGEERIASALTRNLEEVQKKYLDTDPLFQEKIIVYTQLYGQDSAFAKRRETEFNRVTHEIQNQLKVSCPTFAELTK